MQYSPIPDQSLMNPFINKMRHNRSGEFANRDYDQEFIENAAADVSNDLPPLSEEEYKYYMSL